MVPVRQLSTRLLRRGQATTPDEELADVLEQCKHYELGIDAVLFLASRMVDHPNKSVRAYSNSIQRVLGGFALTPVENVGVEDGKASDEITVSRPISTFVRRWGDDLQAESPLPGTSAQVAAPTERETRQAWMCTDWLVREHTAAWLELAGLSSQAKRLLDVDVVTSPDDLAALVPTLRQLAVEAEIERNRRAEDMPEDEEGSVTSRLTAHIVGVCRAASSAGGASAAVEAGAVWCPQASRATDAAMWAWAWQRAIETRIDPETSWKQELHVHVARLHASALALLEALVRLSL